MVLSVISRKKALCIGVLLAASLVISGCIGIQPYEPPNHREEGPQKGLFTGSQGEWVILASKAPQSGAEEKQDGTQDTETNSKEDNKEEEDNAQIPASGVR